MRQRVRTFDKVRRVEAGVHHETFTREQSQQPGTVHQSLFPSVFSKALTVKDGRTVPSTHPLLFRSGNPEGQVAALRYLEQNFGNRAVQRYLQQKSDPTLPASSGLATKNRKNARIGPGGSSGRNLSFANESRSTAGVNFRHAPLQFEGQSTANVTPVDPSVPGARQSFSVATASPGIAKTPTMEATLSIDVQKTSLPGAVDGAQGLKIKRLASRRSRRSRRKRLSEQSRPISLPDDLDRTALDPTADPFQIHGRDKFLLRISPEQSFPLLPKSTTLHSRVTKSEPALNDIHSQPSDLVQRISLSDLNPIEAAKKLAERAWGAIKKLGSSAWNTAKSLGGKAWNTAKSAGSSVWNGIKSFGSAIWNTAKSVGSRAWNTAKSMGSRVWNTVKGLGSRAWNWAKSMGSKAWSGAKSLGSKAWNWTKSFGRWVWSGAKSLGSRLWSTAKNWGSRAWATVKGGVSKVWGKIKALGGKVWDTVKGAANKAWEGAKHWGGKAWNFAKSVASKLTLKNLCKAIGWLVGKAYQAIAPYVKKAWAFVKKWGGKAWEFAKKWGGKLWDGVKSWFGKIKDLAKRALSKAYSTVKNLARRAWDGAKRLGIRLLDGAKRLGNKAWSWAKSAGSRAWNGAKSLGSKLWNTAKSLGGRAIDAAKRLGTAAWEKAKALGGKIYDRAKQAASKLLSVADRLTGGLASKVAGMARKILDKAAGVLSWVLNKARDLANRALDTAKRWASKALETAKSWGSKLWSAAKSAATKAWSTAKSWASKAWSTAKSWAGKAWSTAKSWASKAWSTAKSWAGKAWSTAKSWASKAWSAAKSWAGKAWNTVKGWAGKAWNTVKGWAGKAWDGVKWLGGKAWSFAKWVGGRALDLAKRIGLDKAWNYVKDWGGKALQLAKDAASWVWKRLKRVIEIAKPVAEIVGKAALLLNPVTRSLVMITAACKTLGCVLPKLMAKGSTSQAVAEGVTEYTPVISTVKDGCGCLTGENMVSGQKEGTGERAVRCVLTAIDIASIVAAFFSAGSTAVAGQAAKGGIRAWLKRLFKIGGKELSKRGEKELAQQLAKMGEKELADILAKMGEKELKELAEQGARAGEKGLADKVEKELAKRVEKETARAVKIPKILAEACAIGSVNCRKLPAVVLAEAGPYPSIRGVPFPSGMFRIQKSALSGVVRQTEVLQDIVRQNRKLWPHFDKALAKAEKMGLDWPVDAAGNAWQVHHVKPVAFGGDNAVANLFPLAAAEHSIFSNWWMAVWRSIRARFTDADWESVYTLGKKSVPGSKIPKGPIP